MTKNSVASRRVTTSFEQADPGKLAASPSKHERYRNVCESIENAARAHARDPAKVQLLAVSKRQSIAAIMAVAACGQRHFGENYVQEALEKIAAIADPNLCWHFIGRLQSNKTKAVANKFDWVHSVDRLKIAERLNQQRDPSLAPLNVCIEVNISGESGKAGVGAPQVAELVSAVRDMPRLRLRGLMALPAPRAAFDEQRTSFRALADLMHTFASAEFDTLSMGTSQDFEAAIAEGATIVRIGTALFGPRE